MSKAIVSHRNDFHIKNNNFENEMKYYNDNFPTLRNFIDVVFHYNKQINTPLRLFSHEELYRIVYTICRQGYKKLLYENILEICSNFCADTVKELENIKQNETWLTILSQVVANYVKSFDVIINIFAYLDKTYLMEELNTSLSVVLKEIFEDNFFVGVKDRLSYSLCMYVNNNIQIPQNLIITITQALYSLNPSYAYINPMLFRKTVSNFIVPKNFNKLQVDYTKLEAQYFLSLIKNENTIDSFNFPSPSYSSIYSIEIDSDEISEKSYSSCSTLYCKSPSLFSTTNEKEKSLSTITYVKRCLSNTDICDNSIENSSHKKICIKSTT
ncbi:hypothetical protein BCR32DRAFT_278621 [Anaeromyces robustus]|uniref:Cullin N-terminal domain-containing protein n=1 Tax=Anaeromyces robustus TaxID=1754192 RepID=A0A1Y1XBH7_9FUNG|nr:hypothetical protein BCR32DRAFT_278621 [Anaeromyces robustus]|eukprot:ORX82786.1 hypothetical protein BCR32DRAFT_278621 [Anaeromyces robustus]